jgi:hypothetical protein
MVKFILITLLFLSGSVLAENKTVQIDEKYRTFLDSYCIDCHNAKKTKGKVRLDSEGFSFNIESIEDADRWQKILGAINSQEMPPEDEKQPDAMDKLKFLEMLSNKMVEARVVLSDSGGKTFMRRLNQREYTNTIYDLLGVQVDASNLPTDQSATNFDTDGGALFMSSDQIEQYLQIARDSLKNALILTYDIKPVKNRIHPEKSANKLVKNKANEFRVHYENALAFEKSKDPKKTPKQFGLIDLRDADIAHNFYNRFYNSYDHYLKHHLSKTGSLMSLFHPHVRDPFSITTAPIEDKNKTVDTKDKKSKEKWLPNGTYVIRARVARTETPIPERSFLDLGISLKEKNFKLLKTFHITATPDAPQIIEATVLLDENFRNLAFKEKHDIASAMNQFTDTRKKSSRGPDHVLWIDWIEWEGPFNTQRPELVQFILNNMKNVSDSTVRELISQFAKEAFRQAQASPEYIDKLCQIYQIEKNKGKKPLEAIIEPLSIILASPGFIYISEPIGDQTAKKITQRELAIKLAYFLWSAPPDKELYQLADNNQLEDEKVLMAQVDRMLKDKKAERFYSSFAYQWLGMERLSFFQLPSLRHDF